MTDMPIEVSTFESKPLYENLIQIEGCLVIRVLNFLYYVHYICHAELYGRVLTLGGLEYYETVPPEPTDHSFV